MPHRSLQHLRSRLFVGCGGAAQLEAPGDRRVGQGFRHATVDDIHHATDGPATVKERCGTTHDLHAINEQRIETHRVVGTDD